MITKAIAMKCSTYYHRTIRNRKGEAALARCNGQVKEWKRDPTRFRVPVKHGFRDCFYITNGNANDWLPYNPVPYIALQRRDSSGNKKSPQRQGLEADALATRVNDGLWRVLADLCEEEGDLRAAGEYGGLADAIVENRLV